MADSVRHLMEDMVPELEDLSKKGYFTKSELRSVVKKRTNFEYMMKRRAAKLDDFLRYAEYEMKLDGLRRVRRKLMGAAAGKRSLADFCITRRAHFIFERATRKFRGELGLWVKWLDFCRSTRSNRQTSRVLAKVLKLHPTVPGLWIRAAAWEFEHKRDASAARKLMQRGLRMCPKSSQLWLELFRLELAYAAQLRARRAVMGVPVEDSGDATDGAEALLKGAIALTVLKNAFEEFPEDVGLRHRFLVALEGFHFEGREDFEQILLQDIRQRFGQDGRAWDVLARRAWETSEAGASVWGRVERAAAVYEEALSAEPSAAVFGAYSDFLREQLEASCAMAESEGDEAAEHSAAVPQLAEACLDVLRRSSEAGFASSEAMAHWSLLARRSGLLGEAQLAASACSGPTGCGSAQWAQRLGLAGCRVSIQLPMNDVKAKGTSHDGQMPALADVLESALSSTYGADKVPVWLNVLELLATSGDVRSLSRVMGRLETVLSGSAKGPLRGGMGEVAAAAVEATQAIGGLSAARTLYCRLLKLPPAGGSFFHRAIDLELGAAADGTENSSQLRHLFDTAAEHYGHEDSELWLRFLWWEGGYRGTSVVSKGSVYWRAMKALADPAEFITSHQQLCLGVDGSA